MFTGSIVAIITPFLNGEVDYKKLRELVEFHIANGTNGIVPCGTTGESPTLTHDEHDKVIKEIVDVTKGNIICTGGNRIKQYQRNITINKECKRSGSGRCIGYYPIL